MSLFAAVQIVVVSGFTQHSYSCDLVEAVVLPPLGYTKITTAHYTCNNRYHKDTQHKQACVV